MIIECHNIVAVISLCFFCRPKLSHVGHVIQEIVSTEDGYVKDLSEVIDVS